MVGHRAMKIIDPHKRLDDLPSGSFIGHFKGIDPQKMTSSSWPLGLQAVGVPVEPQAARALRRRRLGMILFWQGEDLGFQDEVIFLDRAGWGLIPRICY